MKKKVLISSILIIILVIAISSFSKPTNNQPTISFSFDDGSIKDYPQNTNVDWNLMLLNKLKQHKIEAVLFVKGKNLDNNRGKEIITSWDNNGHLIANHTYSHPYFNSKKVSLNQFKNELLKNDSLISNYVNYTKLFRFPYLKEGNTLEKRDGFRTFLKKQNYRVGHVTIDASDWYIDQRLIKKLSEKSSVDLTPFKEYYIKHILDRATYYNNLGIELTGDQIHHSLLLHHNLTAALFIDELIVEFKKRGWKIINAKEAYQHSIYNKHPNNLPAGESLLWAIAKKTGNYESQLRYPAEDSRYEKKAMDSSGL
jgi:peptidoglycan/xylan/chitin deacetylase (PgdA/CDA1 family)